MPCWARATAARETAIKACYPPSLWSRDMKEASDFAPWVGSHWNDMKGQKMSCFTRGRNRGREATEHQWGHAGVSTRNPAQAWGSPTLHQFSDPGCLNHRRGDYNNLLRREPPKGGMESESEARLWSVFEQPSRLRPHSSLGTTVLQQG